MTPRNRELFLSVQAEVATDLERSRAALPTLEAKQREAAAAERLAAVDYREAQQEIGKIRDPEPALRSCLNFLEAGLKAARGDLAKAKGALEENRRLIARGEHALAQFDELLAPAEAAEAA